MDTVSTHKEDDKVDADKNARHTWSPMSHDAIIHDDIPIFTSEDLKYNLFSFQSNHFN